MIGISDYVSGAGYDLTHPAISSSKRPKREVKNYASRTKEGKGKFHEWVVQTPRPPTSNIQKPLLKSPACS